MPIVQVAPATRQGMRLLISLFGMSETGKTMSALRLAAGIEPDPAKRGLLDTEGGERGRAYVDHIPGGYLYGSLSEPFTPERYIEALQDFVQAGVTTLVVDSVSHAWFAAGGVLDMVEQSTDRNEMARWARPKRRLARLTGKWLGCGINLILCSRGKQPLVEEMVDGKKKYVLGPVTPIQEKSLRFDMTIMALMLGDGRFSIAKEDGGKCPGALREVFASGTVMDERMGARLVAWVGGQDFLSPQQRVWRLDATTAAEAGSEAFRKFWKELPADGREHLKARLANFQSIATAADADATARAQGQASADGDDPLADPFAGGKALPQRVQAAGGAAAAATAPEDDLVADVEECGSADDLDALLANKAFQAKQKRLDTPGQTILDVAIKAAREGFRRNGAPA